MTIKSREQAENYRYNKWAGNPNGTKYTPSRCAYPVWSGGRGSMQHQCLRPCGYGPEGLFCQTHAPMMETNGSEWYHVYGDTITPVIVTKSTTEWVWTGGRREKKHSPYYHYFETRDNAKKWIVHQAEKRIERLTEELGLAKTALEKAKTL